MLSVEALGYTGGALARVAEWQTRRTQNPLLATTCGFESHLGHNCDVARHRGQTNPRSLRVEWLVAAGWVEGAVAEEFALLAEDSDVEVGDEHNDAPAFVGAAGLRANCG